MGIRELMIAVRKWSGMSQPKLARASGWDDGNISKFEHGKQGATPESIDTWIDGCGYELIAVPKGTLDSREIAALPPKRRDLVLRLTRLMLGPPVMSDEKLDPLWGLVERWERQRAEALGSSPPEDDPATAAATSQDKRFSSS